MQALLEANLVMSIHDHTFVTPENIGEIFEYNHLGRNVTGYEGLAVSGMDVVFENYMDGTCTITSKAGWKWTDIIHDLGIRWSDFAHQDLLIKADTLADIYRAKPEGKIAVVSVLEVSHAGGERTGPGGCAIRARGARDGHYLL